LTPRDATDVLLPVPSSVRSRLRSMIPGNQEIPDAVMQKVMEEVGKLPEGADKEQRAFPCFPPFRTRCPPPPLCRAGRRMLARRTTEGPELRLMLSRREWQLELGT